VNYRCRVKPQQGGDIPKMNKEGGCCGVQPPFLEWHHLWAIPIIKHEANAIMNSNRQKS